VRVAVHFAPDHPLSGGEQAVAAFRLGRIEDGLHNAPVGHDEVPLDEYLQRMLELAAQEYPGHEITQDESVANRISIERLVDNGDGTSRWINADQFDPEQHTAAGAGAQIQRDVTVNQQAAGGAG
jgi:hypothetical protein